MVLADNYDFHKRQIPKMDEKQLRKMKRDFQGLIFLIDQQMKNTKLVKAN
jgi:hypothetical protein